MRIVITGSGGFVGRHLLPKLHGEDNQVLALRRGGERWPDPNIFFGPADLADLEQARNWPEDVDAVVHLAAVNPQRSSGSDLAVLRHANVAGTAALARRAAREGVRRMVFVSSANVHENRDDNPIRETDTLAPQSAYAATKREAEQAFWTSLTGSDTEGCVLRPAPVYGPGGRGNFAALVKLAKLPFPLPLQGLGGLRSLVAVDHLADVIALCLHAPGAAGETFLVADEGPLTPAGVVHALREGWGRAPRLLPIPAGPLERLAGALGKGEFWRNLTGTFVLDTRAIQERLEWRSPVSTREKLQQLAPTLA